MRILAVLLSLLAVPALAADVTLTYSPQEAQAAIQLYDLATKSAGLQAAEAALHLTKKIQAAQAQAAQAAQAETAKPTDKK